MSDTKETTDGVRTLPVEPGGVARWCIQTAVTAMDEGRWLRAKIFCEEAAFYCETLQETPAQIQERLDEAAAMSTCDGLGA